MQRPSLLNNPESLHKADPPNSYPQFLLSSTSTDTTDAATTSADAAETLRISSSSLPSIISTASSLATTSQLNANQTQHNSSGSAAAEFWSVARLSLERSTAEDVMAAAAVAAAAASTTRVPFYRNDISKHFQVFRHGETTHSHGIG